MNTETLQTVWKLLMAVLLAIAIGVGLYFASRTRPPETPVPLSQSAAPAPVAAELAPTQPTPAATNIASASTAEQPKPVPEAAKKLHDLNGLWELSVSRGDDKFDSYQRFQVKETDDAIAVTPVSANSTQNYPATFVGMKLTIANVPLIPQMRYTFEGGMDPSYLEATGTLEEVYAPQDPAQQEVRNVYNAKLVRVTPEMMKAEIDTHTLIERRKNEAKALLDALMQIAARQDGKFPAALNQLSSQDLQDPSLIASRSDRQITYYGGNQAKIDRDKINAIEQSFKGKELSQETMVEWERQLHEVWGHGVPAEMTVFRVEYDNPHMILAGDVEGNIHTTTFGEEDAPPTDNASMRATEMNNLKQLMVIVKMFESENKDYLPGGWLMVYPEYLTDPQVLTSPWIGDNSLSYELLFPGAKEQELIDLARGLADAGSIKVNVNEGVAPESPAWKAELYSMIPTIVSENDLPAEPGKPPARVVAFIDGHVEAVTLADWDTRITPFLR